MLAPKKVLLFRARLQEIEFPNVDELIFSMMAGFPFVGEFPITGVFPPRSREATRTKEDLRKASRQIVRDLESAQGASDDAEMDRTVRANTVAEVERGWLEGPYTAGELNELIGMWMPSKRFGLR